MSITLKDIDKSDTNGKEHESDSADDSSGSAGNEDSDSSSEDEDDEDPEIIARRLGDQLWADIQKARSSVTTATALPPITAKEAAAVVTARTVLSYANADILVHSELSKTVIPGVDGLTAIEMLNRIASDGRVPRAYVVPLSQTLIKLAKSDVLFPPLPAVSSQTTLKRKRDDLDEGDTASKVPSKEHDTPTRV